MTSRMTKKIYRVRVGWYALAVVDWEDAWEAKKNGKPQEETYIDIYRSGIWRGIPSWEVTIRHDHERRDWDNKQGSFITVKAAKLFAYDVAAWLNGGSYPNQFDSKYGE